LVVEDTFQPKIFRLKIEKLKKLDSKVPIGTGRFGR
jgi:hypothetical protein